MLKLEDYYKNFVNNENIATNFSVPAEHSFVTDDFGNDCAVLDSPYINNCGYDSAGALLQHIYGALLPPVTVVDSNLSYFDQSEFAAQGLDTAAMLESGAVYIPSYCRQHTGCRVHIALHGCLQDTDYVQEDFVRHTGYLGWAEANNIVILMPQAKRNLSNPKGCWDWWGYTSSAYASKLGYQNTAIYNMLLRLRQSTAIQ